MGSIKDSLQRSRFTHERVFNRNYRPSGDDREGPPSGQTGSSSSEHRVWKENGNSSARESSDR